MAFLYTPFQYSVQITIDNRTIDYLLTVDETGHLYEAKPMVFDLPEATQQLILGKANAQLVQKIHAFASLFRYIIPLSIVGALNNYQEQLRPLLEKFKAPLQDSNVRWTDFSITHEARSIHSFIYYVFSPYSSGTPQGIINLWKDITYVIDHILEKNVNRDIDAIRYGYPIEVADFFITIIPLLNQTGQQGAYQYLKNVQNDAVRTYLVKALNTSSSETHTLWVLDALVGYSTEEKDISEAIVACYKHSSPKVERVIKRLILLMGKHPSDEGKKICLSILRSNQKVYIDNTARALMKMGVSPQKIVDIVLPFYKAANPKISEASFYLFATSDILFKFIPSDHEALDVYAQTLSKAYNNNIAQSTLTILYEIGIHKHLRKIYHYLQFPKPEIREGMLLLLYHAPLNGQPTKPFIKRKFINCYLNLANDSDDGVSKAAILLIGNIVKDKKGNKCIDHLIRIYKNRPDNNAIRLEIMRSINNLLQHVPFPDQIELIYLDALKNGNVDFRVAALAGLYYSPDEDFKMRLSKYIDDPDYSVREAAKKFPAHKRDFTFDKRKKKPNNWNDIKSGFHNRNDLS